MRLSRCCTSAMRHVAIQPSCSSPMSLTLDDQIEALAHSIRAIAVMGKRWSRQGKDTSGLVDHAMGLEAVLRNLQFQKRYETAFRRLARDLIEAEQEEAVSRVLEAFPDAEITKVERLEEV